MRTSNDEWDVFISHASEDKDDFVRRLAEGLTARGLRVWYDEFSLKVGDRLRESIDHGLGKSRFGIVVLSPNFFSKQWPQSELNGLVTREGTGLNVILPVWHNVTREQVEEFSPILADRVAVISDQGLSRVIEALTQVIGMPTTESKLPRSGPEPRAEPPPPSSAGSRSRMVIRAWWKKGVFGVGLIAALTTALVNLQVIKGWFIGVDRTSAVQLAPDPNKYADGHSPPEGLPPSSKMKSLDKEEPALQMGLPAAADTGTAAPAGAASRDSPQPAADTGGPSGDLAELASQIRKEVESLAKPGEKWTVSEGPRISITLYNPRNPTSGRGQQINASNLDDLESVMESLRMSWANRHREDDEYKRNLLKR